MLLKRNNLTNLGSFVLVAALVILFVGCNSLGSTYTKSENQVPEKENEKIVKTYPPLPPPVIRNHTWKEEIERK